MSHSVGSLVLEVVSPISDTCSEPPTTGGSHLRSFLLVSGVCHNKREEIQHENFQHGGHFYFYFYLVLSTNFVLDFLWSSSIFVMIFLSW
jgi:hypothetical protein